MAPPNGLFRISSYVVFVIVVQLSKRYNDITTIIESLK